MTVLSDEQIRIVDAPLTSLAVIACAGSGKTETAIRRVVAMRALLGDNRGRIALLSFSNIAVDTFRDGYQKLASVLPDGAGRRRVDIDTLDGFITSHVLRPHARRVMNATRTPFLVNGNEPFLTQFAYWEEAKAGKKDVKMPIHVDEFQTEVGIGGMSFFRNVFGKKVPLDTARAEKLVTRMGATGAYTHDLGRYWCYQTLRSEPGILKVLARRYPHVLIDESQDIGTMHETIIELLIKAGVQVSLIGDPSQSIYEFAGATGNFLREYAKRPGVMPLGLTRNYRSHDSIVKVANALSQRNDTSQHGKPDDPGATFYVGYEDHDLPQLLDAFHAEVDRRGISRERAAVLCRASELVDNLSGVGDAMGQGVVKEFAKAALLRDTGERYLEAFEVSARAVFSLTVKPASDLLLNVLNPKRDARWLALRKKLWSFVRNPSSGLPPSADNAAAVWLPSLRAHVVVLLKEIEKDCGLVPVDNLASRISRKKLSDTPLNAPRDLAADGGQRITVQTVHQVKGKSIDAVLYVATTAHAKAMLNGVGTELGRIGYVAATRARELLWVAVPGKVPREVRAQLETAGFREVGGGS
jgi:superfamily I DNA/RNA helicase